MQSSDRASHPAADFSRKLSKYSALAVGGLAGTLAGFESTEAALIITPAGITLVDNPGAPGPTNQAMLDLNGDTVDDVVITVQTASLLDAQGINGASLAGTVGPNSFFYPNAFQASEVVNGGSFFSGGSGAPVNPFGTLANGSGGALAPSVGNWMDDPNAVTAWMGVEFDISGNTHYGWVHITWDPSADTATIHRYAYQDTQGLGAHVPEPSSLALLGLGVAGLAARRRRQGKA